VVDKLNKIADSPIVGSPKLFSKVNSDYSNIRTLRDTQARVVGRAQLQVPKPISTLGGLGLAATTLGATGNPMLAAAAPVLAKVAGDYFPASSARGLAGASKILSPLTVTGKALDSVGKATRAVAPIAGSIFSSKPPSALTPQKQGAKMDTSPTDSTVPPKLLDAIRQVESSGGKHLLSDKGAKGPYQLMDATGEEYHAKLGIKDKYDPYDEAQSRKIAEAILKDYASQLGGDLNKAVTAYHSGVKNVKEGKLGPQGRAYLPAVTSALEKLSKSQLA
jgi:soluble lytic murein transglycosylase-like protein